MNIQVSAKTFRSEEELRANYRSVRNALRQTGRVQDEVERVSYGQERDGRIAELEATIAEMKKRNEALELSKSDLLAAFMSQAKILADLQDEMAGSTNYGLDRKETVSSIVNEVLRGFPGITWGDIISVRRTKDLIRPRHACMRAVAEKRPDLSFPAIGRIFRRDHTTVLHAVGPRKTK